MRTIGNDKDFINNSVKFLTSGYMHLCKASDIVPFPASPVFDPIPTKLKTNKHFLENFFVKDHQVISKLP